MRKKKLCKCGHTKSAHQTVTIAVQQTPCTATPGCLCLKYQPAPGLLEIAKAQTALELK